MNNLKYFKKSEGFTLIEVLLTIAILGIVMAVGASVLIQFFDIIPSSNERMSTRQLAEIELNKLVTLVREAKNVDTGSNTITVSENGEDIEIKFNGSANNIEKGNNNIFINNVKNFDIKDTDQENLYNLIFEKCNTENCDKSVTVKTQALKRNIN